MASSETGGMITGRELVVANVQNSPALAQSPGTPVAQNSHLTCNADGTAAHKPVSGSSLPYWLGRVATGGGGTAYTLPVNSSDSLKRKRGRPRKYGPDGTISIDLLHAASMPQPSVWASRPSRTFSPPVSHPSTTAPPRLSAAVALSPPPSADVHPPPAAPSAKKAGSWPPSRKQQLSEAWGSAGIPLISHTFTVEKGEDVSSKIISFSENGTGTVCIISAHGCLSRVTLGGPEPGIFGGTTTYEGRFHIKSLFGTFLVSEVGGQRRMTGGLNIIFTGRDGQLLFGCVAGCLIAASPVQVTVGTSVPNVEQSANSAGAAGTSLPSRGTLGEASSLLNHSSADCNNVNTRGILKMPWK